VANTRDQRSTGRDPFEPPILTPGPWGKNDPGEPFSGSAGDTPGPAGTGGDRAQQIALESGLSFTPDPSKYSLQVPRLQFQGLNPVAPAPRPGTEPSSPPKPSLDKDKLVKWMDDHAEAKSVGKCARYVRQGMEAGGLNTDSRPNLAKDYGPFLIKLGAVVVHRDGYTPQAGDFAVFEGTDDHPIGHVQVYDGTQWVSDFKQNGYNPYHDDTKSKAYRFP
jgi:hypothetical protein